ncbi:MAG: threonine/serine exporter family protein [Clostridia bacterium]|nr:threonine/serine exporter family protein [Clostridia bacterium]
MVEMVLAFFGSLLPAILYNVSKKHFVWVGLSGVSGWMVYFWLSTGTGRIILATFAGAVSVGIYSEIMARCLKVPATIFSVSGIIPLVPGIGAYNAVQAIVESNLGEAARLTVETIGSAGSIALGIMFSSAIFRAFRRRSQEGKYFKKS